LIDYPRVYDEYWAQPQRWGADAPADAEELADRILQVCGGGRLLDVGCGRGGLVRTLLARGVDAQGVDVAQRVVDHANGFAPTRFCTASVLKLPYGDGEFETVVATSVLEHLSAEDVPRALREVARVSRRGVFLTVATAADREGRWHQTVEDRAWWERTCFAAGLRKHPLAQRVRPFSAPDNEAGPITLVLEKVPGAAARRDSTETLPADMLRESSPRSEARVAQYLLACGFVRPNDVVLDAGCGSGYGVGVLAAGSPASRLVGVDGDESAVRYARENYRDAGPAVEFHVADMQNLSVLADASVDVVVCCEAFTHERVPERALAEFQRVLTPGGRVVVSVLAGRPEQGGQESHAPDARRDAWSELAAQLRARFVLERAYRQIAGGGPKLGDRPGRLEELPLDREPVVPADGEADWWLAVGMKDPVGAGKAGYRETALPDCSDIPGAHVTAFARDYESPWLIRSMVSIGQRVTNAEVLADMARRVRVTASPGSADAGAALCVLGYRMLERGGAAAEEVAALLDQIREYHRLAAPTANAYRWRVSNQYIAGRLLLMLGQRAEARGAFLECAALDCLRFSPLLATKTVDALFLAGLIAACSGEADQAGDCWRRGLLETQRVLAGDWVNIWGRVEQPLPFGLPEVAELADLGARCAQGLLNLPNWPARPGYVWSAVTRRSLRELREWNAKLVAVKAWLERQHADWQQTAERREQMIHEQKKAQVWLKEQWQAFQQLAEQREGIIREQKAWAAELERAKAALAKQCQDWQQLAEGREPALRRQAAWIAELERAKAWLEEQQTAWQRTAEEREAALRQQVAWVAELEQAKAWLAEQQAGWQRTAEERAAELQRVAADRDAAAERFHQQQARHEEKLVAWRRQVLYRALCRLHLLRRLESD